jgi:hypothetical protein
MTLLTCVVRGYWWQKGGLWMKKGGKRHDVEDL